MQHGLAPVEAIEVKSSATYNTRYFDMLSSVADTELGIGADSRAVVYGGTDSLRTRQGELVPYDQVHDRALEWLE